MNRSLWFACGAAVGLAGSLDAADSARSPLTAERMWQIKRLAAPALSPDGKWAAVPVTTYDVKEDKALTDLWLVPTGGGEAAPAHHATSGERVEPAPGARTASGSRSRPSAATTRTRSSTSSRPAAARRAASPRVPTGARRAKWFPDSQAHRVREPRLART